MLNIFGAAQQLERSIFMYTNGQQPQLPDLVHLVVQVQHLQLAHTTGDLGRVLTRQLVAADDPLVMSCFCC